MAAVIGSLMVDIGANVARLQRDMNRAQSTVSKSVSGMKRMATGLAVALVAGFRVRAMIRAGKESLILADKYAKMSRSIGMSVESLSSLNHAAELSGTTFDVVAKSAAKLAKNMKDVRDEVGEALEAFEEINISVVDSSGKMRGTESVLMDIADRFSTMADGSRKTALAMDIFGRSGAALIPLLNAGASGIKEMQAEAVKLGITFDTKTAMAAERVNDQFLRVSSVFRGMTNKIMVKLLPDIEKLVGWMYKLSLNTSQMAEAGLVLSTALKLLVSGGLLVTTTFKLLGNRIASLAASMSFLATGQFKLAFEVLKQEGADAVSILIALWERLQKTWSQEVKPPVFVLPPRVVDDYVAPISTIKDYVEKAFSGMSNAITEFAMTGKASFKDFVNSVIADMTKMMVQQMIVAPLMGGVMDFFNPTTKSANGNVFNKSGLQPFANGGVVNSPTVFPFASGIGLMGEAGSEAIMPLTRIGGKLGVKAQGGGTTINQNISVDARGSSVSSADIENAVARGAAEGYSKVYSDITRRGPIRKAIK